MQLNGKMTSSQSERLEPNWMNIDPGICDRYELLMNRYDRDEPDVADKLHPDVEDRVGPRLWDTLSSREPRVSGRSGFYVCNRRNAREPHTRSDRGVEYRMTYTRSRHRPFSIFRPCARGPVSDRCLKPDFRTGSSRDKLETNEGDIGSWHERTESDTRGRPNSLVTSELETNVSDKHECSFICFWRIENFCINVTSQSCSINSQIFDVLMINGSHWHLRVEHSQYDSLSLYLYRHGEQGCCDIHVELSVLTMGGWNTVKDGIHDQFSPTSPCMGTKLINWSDLFQVKMHLPDDCLTVSCHISIQSSLFNPVQYFMPSRMISHKLVIHSPMLEFSDLKPSEVLNFPIPSIFLEYLSGSDEVKTRSTQTEDQNYLFNDSDEDDLPKLFKEKSFYYVTLRTPTKDFAVHKAVLCAKSPVFNAMFKETMTENNSNVVDVDDIDGDCLSLLLQFFYLESLGKLEWEEAAKLYYAADKYQVDLLKAECRSLLKKALSNKNICDTFILADTHKDEDLRNSSQEYFYKNSKTILCSTEWTHFLFNRVDLASKVLFRFGEHM